MFLIPKISKTFGLNSKNTKKRIFNSINDPDHYFHSKPSPNLPPFYSPIFSILTPLFVHHFHTLTTSKTSKFSKIFQKTPHNLLPTFTYFNSLLRNPQQMPNSNRTTPQNLGNAAAEPALESRTFPLPHFENSRPFAVALSRSMRR